MHKIDAVHATPSNEFTDGNPALGIEATELIAKWFNTVQRELVHLVESAGLTLSDTDDTQITAAISNMLGARIDSDATPDAIADRLVIRDEDGRASFTPGIANDDAVVFSQFEYDFSDVVWEGTVYPRGWVRFPGGFMIQWGTYVSGGNEWTDVEYSWPTSFPMQCMAAVGQVINMTATHQSTISIKNPGTGKFWLNSYGGAYSCFVIAIGR